MIPDSFAKRVGEYTTNNPWKVILFTILWVFGATAGGQFLTFTTDYRAFFSDDNPQLLAFEEVERTYTKFDNVLFVVAPESGNVYNSKTLEAIQFLTEGSWQLPYSIRVDSVTNYQHSYAEEDDLIVEDLIYDPATLESDELQHIRKVVESEPLLYGQLVSYKGHTAGVNVTIQLPGIDETKEVPEVVVATRAMVAEFRQKFPGHELYLTGVTMLNNAFSESSEKDMQTLIPLSFLVILVLIGFILRRWAGTFGTFWIIMLSITSAMGIAGWMGIKLTPASVSAPIIILTLAVADSVHILTNYLHQLRHGESRKDAMIDSMRINLQPVFLTSITTAIGFLSMNFSDAPPFRDLGNIAAIGVMAAFVLSVTLLPALVPMLPSKPEKLHGDKPAFHGFSEFVLANRKGLFYGMGALIVVLIALIPRNEINDQFVEYFDKSIPFRVASDFANDNLVGVYRIEYSLDSGEAGGISGPEFMARVEAFSNWLREQSGVLHVSTYTDIMKRLNRNMHGDNADYYALPDSRELAAQYLLLYEMSLPYGLDLNDRLNVDKSSVRLIVNIENLSVNETLQLEQNARSWLQQNAPAMDSEGTGPSIMFSHITRRNISTMLWGTLLALALISALLILALQSVKMGLISLVPNILPILVAFGVWAIFDGEIGLSLSIVAGMTLGIVVDDTVHFMSKYLRARRERGLDPADSIRYAFSTVGMALWVTTIVLVAGFLMLVFSSFKVNAGMGLMTAVTVALALIIDFLFLPPLLLKLEGYKDE